MAKKRRKKRREADPTEGRYVCPTCGEEIVIPVDFTAGAEQRYVEDCPVCCHPNVIHVEIEPREGDEEGHGHGGGWEEPRVWAEAE